MQNHTAYRWDITIRDSFQNTRQITHNFTLDFETASDYMFYLHSNRNFAEKNLKKAVENDFSRLKL